MLPASPAPPALRAAHVPGVRSLSVALGRAARLALLALGLASGSLACSATRPPPLEPMAALSFRPTQAGQQLWLSTPFAVELRNEREVRLLEILEPAYIGELAASGTHLPERQRALLPLIVAERGATHYRVVCAGEGRRIDVILYRIERDRWRWLPDELRPALPAVPVVTGQSQASL